MKTISKIVFSSLAVLAIASSCSKEIDYSKDNDSEKPVTIYASIPDGGMETKVALTQPNGIKSAIKVAWVDTDAITINGEDFAIDATSISLDGKTAKFIGNDPGAGPYTISYSNLPADLAAQTQSADGDLEHLRYAASIAGVDSYEDVSFTTAWATSHSGTLSTSSVIELQALLPAAISSKVKKVIFTFPEDITTDNKRITVTLTTKGVQSADNKLDVYATLPAGNINLPNILVQFQVQEDAEDLAYNKYSAYREFAPTKVVAGGSTLYLGMNCSNIMSYANADNTNIGTSTNPYLVGDKFQMAYFPSQMGTSTTTYVKLVDDVDLNNEAWTPLNTADPYSKGINFDGNGKTILKLSSSAKYASFAGVLYGAVYDVTFNSATITSSDDKAGVVAGYLGTGTGEIKANCQRVTVINSVVSNTSNQYTGGIAGIAKNLSAAIDDCHVINTTVSGKGGDKQDARVGGLLGLLDQDLTCSNCTAENVTVTGSVNIGGLIGVAYGRVEKCSSSGTVSSTNTTSKYDIGLGGLAGYLDAGTVTECSSSVSINQTTGARSIGGLIGTMKTATLEKSYSIGNVSATYRNVGGLIGLVTNTSGKSSISDCYSTGNVTGAAFVGGLIGLYEKGTAEISRCFATGEVSGTFGLGGLIGEVGKDAISIQDCAAWNSSVTASSIGAANFSSGAVVGVTFPTATITNSFRMPGMKLKAYWGTETGYTYLLDSNYDHQDVGSSPNSLIKQNGDHSTASSIADGQDGYPQFPYHGHYTAETKLSDLAKKAKASGGLGWSDTVWNFPDVTPFLPTLK